MMVLPIKPTKKKAKEDLPIQIYMGVFRWQEMKFLNLEDQSYEKHHVWKFVTANNLNNQFKNGRKFRNIHGKVDIKKKVYGFQAVAEALSDARGLPINEEQCERMIKEAIEKGILHAKFVLESDIYPTDPQTYKEMGLKNRYLILADIPDSTVIHRRLNEQLKAAKSPLRLEKAIRTRIVEA